MSYEGTPFLVADTLNAQAVHEAGNREYQEQLHIALHAAHCAVWNTAAETLREHGRPTMVETTSSYTPEPVSSVYGLSTGLMELSGLTDDPTEDLPELAIPAARISSYNNVLPNNVDTLHPYNFWADGQSMMFEGFMAHPIQYDAQRHGNIPPLAVREFQLAKPLNYVPGERKFRKLQPSCSAIVNPMLHPEKTDRQLMATIRLPHKPTRRTDLTDNKKVEAAVAEQLTKFNDMHILYGIIGAIGRPLGEKPRFGRQ